jgi:hypothetical protein
LSTPEVLEAAIPAFDSTGTAATAGTCGTGAPWITGVVATIVGVEVESTFFASLFWSLLAAASWFDATSVGSAPGTVGFVTSSEPVVLIVETALAKEDVSSAGMLVEARLSFAEEPLSCWAAACGTKTCGATTCGATTCGTTGMTTLARTPSCAAGVAAESSALLDEAFFFPLSGLDVFFVSTFCAFASLPSPSVAAAATVAPITAEKLLWRLPLLASAEVGLPVASGTAFINWLSIFTLIVIATLWPNWELLG